MRSISIASMARRQASMKSGLRDRHNHRHPIHHPRRRIQVSMKSGLGDRNNWGRVAMAKRTVQSLNEVRSWRPEQSALSPQEIAALLASMKSGLGDRNNPCGPHETTNDDRDVSMKSGLGDRNNEPKEKYAEVPWSRSQ